MGVCRESRSVYCDAGGGCGWSWSATWPCPAARSILCVPWHSVQNDGRAVQFSFQETGDDLAGVGVVLLVALDAHGVDLPALVDDVRLGGAHVLVVGVLVAQPVALDAVDLGHEMLLAELLVDEGCVAHVAGGVGTHRVDDHRRIGLRVGRGIAGAGRAAKVQRPQPRPGGDGEQGGNGRVHQTTSHCRSHW